MVEEEDFPSISELWDQVADWMGQLNRGLPEHDQLAEEQLAQACEQVWTAIFHLTCGGAGAGIYLDNFSAPHQWDRDEAFLAATAHHFPHIIADVELQIEVWRERFWRSGGHPTQYTAFRDALADMLIGGFLETAPE
jgi:hypothetical protein